MTSQIASLREDMCEAQKKIAKLNVTIEEKEEFIEEQEEQVEAGLEREKLLRQTISRLRHRLRQKAVKMRELRQQVEQAEEKAVVAMEQAREDCASDLDALFEALMQSDLRHDLLEQQLVAKGPLTIDNAIGGDGCNSLRGQSFQLKDGDKKTARVKAEVRDLIVDLGVLDGLSGTKAFQAVERTLQTLGVTITDSITDRSTMFQQVVTERSEVHQLDFVKRLAEALIGHDFVVPAEPPDGALQTTGDSSLHPLATVRCGVDHVTEPKDAVGRSRQDMVEDPVAPWLHGEDDPPDPTLGHQLDVGHVSVGFMVGDDDLAHVQLDIFDGVNGVMTSVGRDVTGESLKIAACLSFFNKFYLNCIRFTGIC